METADLFLRLALAVLLGLLVGLQREWADSKTAGVRTFALITLLGAIAGMLAQSLGALVIGGAFVALAALLVVSNLLRAGEERGGGMTTEIAALVMLGVGAALMLAPPQVGVAAGAATAILLHLKPQLHSMIDRLEEKDTRAIMRFALLSAVILPVLPNRAYGPYEVLNPFNIWLMVVLIVGLGLVGYLLAKFLRSRSSVHLAGVLGGLVSSTATTFAFARRGNGADAARTGALVIGIASTILYARAAVEMAAVSRSLLYASALPLGVLALVTGGVSLVIALGEGKEAEPPEPSSNPAELTPALIFAAIYAGILLLSAFVRDTLGTGALYPVAAISGVADMDAITLSTARLVEQETLDPNQAWKYIVVAVMSNSLFKALVVGFVGSRALLWRVGIIFGVTILAGGVLVALDLPYEVGTVEAPAVTAH